ncbi:hypothetical protein C7M84_022404 [Penaeus vannamei]|uniref:Uncharacterized protein n=1 Tax=Penaeus vannamei TaxID=6689 RepID=A0A3R7Q2N3_PENVA|nr:hypothetical protein C7M84_022404 [Penaeus vannamei]
MAYSSVFCNICNLKALHLPVASAHRAQTGVPHTGGGGPQSGTRALSTRCNGVGECGPIQFCDVWGSRFLRDGRWARASCDGAECGPRATLPRPPAPATLYCYLSQNHSYSTIFSLYTVHRTSVLSTAPKHVSNKGERAGVSQASPFQSPKGKPRKAERTTPHKEKLGPRTHSKGHRVWSSRGPAAQGQHAHGRESANARSQLGASELRPCVCGLLELVERRWQWWGWCWSNGASPPHRASPAHAASTQRAVPHAAHSSSLVALSSPHTRMRRTPVGAAPGPLCSRWCVQVQGSDGVRDSLGTGAGWQREDPAMRSRALQCRALGDRLPARFTETAFFLQNFLLPLPAYPSTSFSPSLLPLRLTRGSSTFFNSSIQPVVTTKQTPPLLSLRQSLLPLPPLSSCTHITHTSALPPSPLPLFLKMPGALPPSPRPPTIQRIPEGSS